MLTNLTSYLQGRQQIVKLNDAMLNPIEVTSGTGQGYPIGAMLFILFIADLPKCIVSSQRHLSLEANEAVASGPRDFWGPARGLELQIWWY